MPRKIIAAYNDAPDAKDGLALAGALAAFSGGEILVARVMQDLTIANSLDRSAQRLMRQRMDETRRVVAETLGVGRSVEVFPIVDASIPGALHDVIRRERADLMTFGATHLGRLGRFAFGGAAESVLTGSTCPVAVAPHGFRDAGSWRPGVIGVAYDGSAEADAALDLAGHLVGITGAGLRLIAVEPSWLKHRIRVGGPPDHARGLEERLDDAAERASAWAPVQRTLLSGDPAGTLATEAASLDALVMGSHGRGPLGRVLLSSVSAALMHAPACPLFVVPRRGESE